LKNIREKKSDALVATDLAGRGIDVPDVTVVINYNMAKTIEGNILQIPEIF
jgi:ATP-dependent RNA helicase DDX23/PRP28